jgi:hypothetical protein
MMDNVSDDSNSEDEDDVEVVETEEDPVDNAASLAELKQLPRIGAAHTIFCKVADGKFERSTSRGDPFREVDSFQRRYHREEGYGPPGEGAAILGRNLAAKNSMLRARALVPSMRGFRDSMLRNSIFECAVIVMFPNEPYTEYLLQSRDCIPGLTYMRAPLPVVIAFMDAMRTNKDVLTDYPCVSVLETNGEETGESMDETKDEAKEEVEEVTALSPGAAAPTTTSPVFSTRCESSTSTSGASVALCCACSELP